MSIEFTRIIRESRLPHLTLQGLLHAHATLAPTAGINPKAVAERLGHASVVIALDTYSHVLPGLQEEAAQAVEDLLSQAWRKRLAAG